MWIGEDDCLGIAVEGCGPSRFGGNGPLGFDLVDNEFEMVSGMNNLSICDISTPNCVDFSKIDIFS